MTKRLERRRFLQSLATGMGALPAQAVSISTSKAADEVAENRAGMPAISASSMLVDNADGTVRESKSFRDIRDILDVSGRYNASSPYVSQMERFRQFGIGPEDVDGGNEIGNHSDAAIPLREMFGQGHHDNITVFNLAAGRQYNINSWDPNDSTRATAINLLSVSQGTRKLL